MVNVPFSFHDGALQSLPLSGLSEYSREDRQLRSQGHNGASVVMSSVSSRA